MKKLFILIFLILTLLTSPTQAEFLSDVIVTSSNAIWTDSRAYNTLNDAITAVGANERTIVIVNQQTVTTLTVPANVTLKFERDGSIANSAQLTINTRNIIASNRQIFTGAGDIDFATGSVIKSGWFSSFIEAVNQTSDDELTLIVSKQDYITADAAVGNSVTLKWESTRNRLIANSGFELSNISKIEAGDYQLFAGAGDFDFVDGTSLNLSWFNRLRSVLTWVENENVTVIVPGENIVDYSDTTTSNISFDFNSRQGSFNISVGQTLTIYSPSNIQAAPIQQIFTGGKAVLFTNSSGVLSTGWFTGIPDGSTDNTDDFQAAIDSCPSNGSRIYTPGHSSNYIVSNLLIYKPLIWYGDAHGTFITAKSDATGYMVHIDGGDANATVHWHNALQGQLYNVVIRDMMFCGNMRTSSIGAIHADTIDHVNIQNMFIEDFQRESLKFTSVRESTIENVRTRWCGNKTGDRAGYPNVNLDDDGSGVDSNNNIYFNKFFSVYAVGDHVWLDTANGEPYNVRKIFFDQCFFHGLVDAVDAGGAAPNPFLITFTTAQKAFRIFDVGTVEDVTLAGCQVTSLGVQTAGFKIATGSNGNPTNFRISNSTISGRYSTAVGADAANDIVIYASAGVIFLNGNYISGSGQALANNLYINGAALSIGTDNYLSGTGPYINNQAYATKLDTDNNNSFWNYQGAQVRGFGDLQVAYRANLQAMWIRSATTELTLSGATTSWNSSLPAGTIILGVTARVTELITGATSFDVGVSGGDTDLFLDGVAVAAGTTADLEDANASFTAPFVNSSLGTILVTAVGGTVSFSAGKVRLTVFYIDLTSPTS